MCSARLSGTKIFYKGGDKLPLESHSALHMGGTWRATSELSWQFRVLGLQAAFFCTSFQPSVPILYFHTSASAQFGSALPLLSAFLPFIPAQVPHSLCFSSLLRQPLATYTLGPQSYRTSSMELFASVQRVVVRGCKQHQREIPDN